MTASDPEPLAALLRSSSRVVAFTGAGISTESGIPDYRSAGGVWTRYDPMQFTFDRYVESSAVRADAWEMRREFFARSPRPNAAHLALARLEEAGRCLGVVTQNIDGLHQLAGSSRVVELHGSARSVMCIGAAPTLGIPDGCGFTESHTWALAQVDAGVADPPCPSCGGIVKSATVSFGQVLDPEVVDSAAELAGSADLLLTVGSSLQVHPAAGLPEVTLRAGGSLAIVNDEPTPLDDLASVVLRGRAGVVLAAAVEASLS